MKKLIIAALLAASTATAADAVELTCGQPTIFVGKQSKDAHDTVIAIDVVHDDGDWQVRHRMGNGSEVRRESQYTMQDASEQGRYTQWRGLWLKDRNLNMVGEIKQDKRGQLFYVEWLYYRGELRMNMSAPCKMQAANLQPVPPQEQSGAAKDWPRWLKP